MSIKSDRWIRQMAESYGMIEPFEPGAGTLQCTRSKVGQLRHLKLWI